MSTAISFKRESKQRLVQIYYMKGQTNSNNTRGRLNIETKKAPHLLLLSSQERSPSWFPATPVAGSLGDDQTPDDFLLSRCSKRCKWELPPWISCSPWKVQQGNYSTNPPGSNLHCTKTSPDHRLTRCQTSLVNGNCKIRWVAVSQALDHRVARSGHRLFF